MMLPLPLAATSPDGATAKNGGGMWPQCGAMGAKKSNGDRDLAVLPGAWPGIDFTLARIWSLAPMGP
jgi:hypothetical protein